VAVLLKVRQIAKDKNLRQPRRIEPVIHNHAPALVERRAQHLAQGRGLHTGGPQRDRGVDPPVQADPFGLDPSRPDACDLRVRMHSTPNFLSDSSAFAERSSGTWPARAASLRATPRAILQDRCAEILAHVKLRNVADRSCQLHSGWSTTYDDKFAWMPAMFHLLPFGELKGKQTRRRISVASSIVLRPGASGAQASFPK